MNILDAAHEIAVFLKNHKVSYAILGGLAVQYHGEPRLTHDVDLMVMVPPKKLDEFLDGTLAAFRPRIRDAKSFALKNRVLLIRSTAPNPDFQIGVKAPLSINPEHTPGFSPGSRMG